MVPGKSRPATWVKLASAGTHGAQLAAVDPKARTGRVKCRARPGNRPRQSAKKRAFEIPPPLNVVYLALGALVFAWSVRHARVHGTLLQMGE